MNHGYNYLPIEELKEKMSLTYFILKEPSSCLTKSSHSGHCQPASSHPQKNGIKRHHFQASPSPQNGFEFQTSS